MNVAFSALVLLAIVLPGFIFQQSFRRTEGERFLIDPSAFSQATASACVFAALLHLGAAIFLHLFASYQVIASDLLALLIGADSGSLKVAYNRLAANWSLNVGYFLTLFLGARLLGWLLREVATRYKLDRSGGRFTKFFRFDTPWYYLFKGYDEVTSPAGVYVACTVEVGEGCILYHGLLVDFFLRRDGTLDRIVLTQVERRPLAEDKELLAEVEDKPGAASEDRFYPIEGDYFVIKYEDATSLNVRYFWLTRAAPVAASLGTDNGEAA